MIRYSTILMAVSLVLCISGCSEDDEYGSIIQAPTNNEFSSVWRGTYRGSCMLTIRGEPTMPYVMELRVSDLGDNSVRIRSFLVPNFVEAELGYHQGFVTNVSVCSIQRLYDSFWYMCSLYRAGSNISGSIQVFRDGHSAEPEWVISGIHVSLEE